METCKIRSFILAAALALSTQFSAAATPADLLRDFRQAQLIIVAGQKHCIVFDVYIAETTQQRRNGLMFVETMDLHEGMLFLYPAAGEINMWMKNTLLSLDMLFFNSDLAITHIHRNAVPLSEAIISSNGNVNGVIELNGGAAEQFGIAVGDRIIIAESVNNSPVN